MRVNFRNFHTVHFKNAGPSVGSCSSKRDRIFEQIWWPDHKSKYFTFQANDELHHHHSVGDVTNAGIFNGYVLRFFFTFMIVFTENSQIGNISFVLPIFQVKAWKKSKSNLKP